MNNSIGKVIYKTFSEAANAASKMRAKYNENYVAYEENGNWYVGGTHVKSKIPYKRVKTMEEIYKLFRVDEFDEDKNKGIDEIKEYSDLIFKEFTAGKISNIGDETCLWTLNEVNIKTGRDLEMKSDKEYLVLHLNNGNLKKVIMMGGSFSPYIPLIKKQANFLINKPIIWHT